MHTDDSAWWLPNFYTEFGGEVMTLWWVIFVITMILFIGVWGAMGMFIWKYRRRAADGRAKAYYTHGSHKLEVAWTLIPTAILLVIALWSNVSWARVKQTTPDASEIGLTLKVVAQQFSWNIFYPGEDGLIDTPDDIKMDRVFCVPLDENILIKLTSQDVIHSLFIPNMCVKQDAVPGFVGNVWFRPERASDPGPDGRYNPSTIEGLARDDRPYEIACAELCGYLHHTMVGYLTVLPRVEWNEWMGAEIARRRK